MLTRTIVRSGVALFAAIGLLAAVGATASDGAALAKPGFPSGTWSGTGVIVAADETAGGHTTHLKGKLAFTISVSGGKVTGTGKWTYTQLGSGGDIQSKIVGVAPITFAGTPTKPTFAGTLKVKSQFVGYGKVPVTNSFTRPMKGSLLIKKAGACKVTGGHSNMGANVNWTALLNGSGTCLT